jgi:hypothetical protein
MGPKETSMIELTAEQRQELDGPPPARARDPQTNETYVLVRADVYERLRTVLDGDDATYVLVRADVYKRLRAVLDGDDARLMEPLLADLDPEDWVDASVYEGKP